MSFGYLQRLQVSFDTNRSLLTALLLERLPVTELAWLARSLLILIGLL